jgi:hypothetical protein
MLMSRSRGVSWTLPVRLPSLSQKGAGDDSGGGSGSLSQGLRIALVVAFYFVVSISLVFLNKFVVVIALFPPLPLFLISRSHMCSLCFVLQGKVLTMARAAWRGFPTLFVLVLSLSLLL